MAGVQLSTRGNINVHGVIPQVPKTFWNPVDNPDLIDLSLAENNLNRGEVLEILRSFLEADGGIQWKVS
jgi:hypothetical protein